MGVRVGHSTLTLAANCVRAGCHEEVAYDPRSPALYCSAACRVAAARDQKWLLKEMERLTALAGTTHGDAQWQAKDRLKVVVWHLRRYAPAWAGDPEIGGYATSAANQEHRES